MVRRSSPHVHTQFCDGRNTAEEMALSAMYKGFVSLGFSSHARQGFYEEFHLNEERETAYLAEVRRLREQCAGTLRVWRGMERDLYSNADRGDYEYVIGSVHFLPCQDGDMLPVDAAEEIVREGIRQHFGGDGIRFAQAYYALLGGYVRAYRPDIIGHFDLVCKNNQDGELFSTDHPAYVKAATEAMEEAFTGCQLLEINTGAMARYGAASPYPSLPLLKYWKALGGEVILSSDCHVASQIDFGYDKAVEHIRSAGYKKAAILGRQDSLFEWFEAE